MFQAESAERKLDFPPNVTIEYAQLGVDTLGVSHHTGNSWHIQISSQVEKELLTTVVYHELGHVMGLDHCKGKSIMNYYYMVPLTDKLKRKLFDQIEMHRFSTVHPD